MAQSDAHVRMGLREGLQQVGEDAERIKEDISAMGHTIAKTARTGAAAAKEGVKEGVEKARERGEMLVESLSDRVVQRPLTSLAIAAGAGVVLGLLIFRPRA